MNIDETMEYIHQTSWRGSRLGLTRIEELLRRMGSPQQKLKFVHVAGTNGKGSTCAMLAAILQEAGYNTGLYTSPFISRFNERMRINGAEISDGELTALVERVRPLVDAMEDKPTEFEMITALAFEHYLEHRCDIVVLEVGLGGRLDSTNVIAAPEAAVITRIGLDHMEILGGTIERIAGEKAGIIKPGAPVISSCQEEAALDVIEAECARQGCTLALCEGELIRPLGHSLEGQEFSYKEWKKLKLGLLGGYQLENAATVLETVGALRNVGWNIPDAAVRAGFARARWPGRFEALRREPLFLIDGAHNPNGADALARCLRDYLPGQKLTFLMGVMRDKDYKGIISALAQLANAFVTVTPRNKRALPAGELAAEIAGVFSGTVFPAGEVEDGVEAAERLAGEGPVCALGSLYMSGDVRRCFIK